MNYKRKLPLPLPQKLVCFGIGNMGDEFYHLAKSRALTISYFCDNDTTKRGTDFFGIPVVSLETLLQEKESYIFLVTDIRFENQIISQLNEAGIEEIYLYSEERLSIRFYDPCTAVSHSYKKRLQLPLEKKLICFGTGELGKEFVQIAKDKKIEISYFSDSDSRKWGTEFHGIPVVSLETSLPEKEDYIFLVTNKSFQDEIVLHLNQEGVKEVYLYSEEKPAILFYNPENTQRLTIHNLEEERAEVERNEPDSLIVEQVGINITEHCNLKCKHCSGGFPYKESPKHMSFEEVKAQINYISTYVDKLLKFTVLGGETYLHPEFYEVVRYATDQTFIKYVNLISNGTIPLKEEKLATLDPYKTRFVFSNYGEISDKIEGNVALLKKYKFPFSVVENKEWFLIDRDIYDRGETQEETKEKYDACFYNFCYSFKNEYHKFARCSMSVQAYQEKSVPEEDLDWVDIDTSKRPLSEIKEELRSYLKKDYLTICKYCAGRDITRSTMVPVAEQL